MWRIEKPNCSATMIALSGRIQAEDIAGIEAEMRRCSKLKVLDLTDVTLVDVTAVRFLSTVEGNGIGLLQCPPYVRAWIGRERAEAEQSSESGSGK